MITSNSLWKSLKNQKVAVTHLAMGIDTQVTHHIVAMEKVAEQHILTKCSKSNTFQVITDLVHDFRDFNAFKIISKIHKKIITQDPGLILTQGNLLVAEYIYSSQERNPCNSH